jgi:murein DD-endopeptidase MepM/ murein hydrolase activator NlpD
VYIELSFPDLVNLRPAGEQPRRQSLQAHATQRVAIFEPVDGRAVSRCRPEMTVLYWGTGAPAPDESFRYAFPFRGEPAVLVQGIDGAYTHQGKNRYAFDFAVPVGTDVVAARAGTVLFVADGFGDGAPDPSYEERANEVFILHDDGTVAGYGHLSKGLRVALGERIELGDVLGRSGNSGYSRGPHLHFEVSTQQSGTQLESIPIRFRGDVVPVEGQRYGPFPDGAPAAKR